MKEISPDRLSVSIKSHRDDIVKADDFGGFIDYLDRILEDKNDKQRKLPLDELIAEYAQSEAITHTDDLFNWARYNVSAVDDFLAENDISSYSDSIGRILGAAQVWAKEQDLLQESAQIINYVQESKAYAISDDGITEEQNEEMFEFVNDLIRTHGDTSITIAEMEDFVEEICQNQTQVKKQR